MEWTAGYEELWNPQNHYCYALGLVLVPVTKNIPGIFLVQRLVLAEDKPLMPNIAISFAAVEAEIYLQKVGQKKEGPNGLFLLISNTAENRSA
jgi:hypothetical protein